VVVAMTMKAAAAAAADDDDDNAGTPTSPSGRLVDG